MSGNSLGKRKTLAYLLHQQLMRMRSCRRCPIDTWTKPQRPMVYQAYSVLGIVWRQYMHLCTSRLFIEPECQDQRSRWLKTSRHQVFNSCSIGNIRTREHKNGRRNGQNSNQPVFVIGSSATPDPLPVEVARIWRMFPLVGGFWVYRHNVWCADRKSGSIPRRRTGHKP
jgi:hypothetical protein